MLTANNSVEISLAYPPAYETYAIQPGGLKSGSRHRQPPLRLRHLPGGLPLEPFRPPDSDRGIPSETGFAFSSKRGSKGLFP